MHTGRLRRQSEMPKDIGKTSPEYCSRREIRVLFLHKVAGFAVDAIEERGDGEGNYAANYNGVGKRGTECKGEGEGRVMCGGKEQWERKDVKDTQEKEERKSELKREVERKRIKARHRRGRQRNRIKMAR